MQQAISYLPSLSNENIKYQFEVLNTICFSAANMSVLFKPFDMQMTAHKAFQFCKQYKRSTEFRRLCEIIRNHLANLNKYRDQRDRPDLTAPESCQLYLDTRVEQLKIATELSLWQVCSITCLIF
jgi:translation initiation factor 3 subunit A